MTLTPSQAAEVIGCSPQQVRTLIRVGRLRARRVSTRNNQHGYRYTIALHDAELYRDTPQPKGYPRGRKRPNTKEQAQ
jgi:hypothetical protein